MQGLNFVPKSVKTINPIFKEFDHFLPIFQDFIIFFGRIHAIFMTKFFSALRAKKFEQISL